MKTEIELYLDLLTSELDKFQNTLNIEDLIKAKEIIIESELSNGRIHVTGIGKPSYVAKYIASLLSSTGTPAYFLDGTEAIHGGSGQVKQDDVVIAISNSGETVELKKTIMVLINNRARIISVVGNQNSWLAENSEVILDASTDFEGDVLNKPPRISILKEIMILQILSILLQNDKKINEEKYLNWHPGGTIGNNSI